MAFTLVETALFACLGTSVGVDQASSGEFILSEGGSVGLDVTGVDGGGWEKVAVLVKRGLLEVRCVPLGGGTPTVLNGTVKAAGIPRVWRGENMVRVLSKVSLGTTCIPCAWRKALVW